MDLQKEPMKVSLETISSVEKSIQIEVPEEQVTRAYNHAVAHLQREVRIPGFRPGRAPVPLLLKKYEETLRNEVLQTLLPEYSNQAIHKAGISPIGHPRIQDIHFKKNAPLSFTVLVDIRPDIQLAPYTGLILPQQAVTVTESDIENGLERLREQQGYLESYPDDHSIVTSDYVMIDFLGTVNGQSFTGKKEATVCVGSKTIFSDIEEALLSKKKGDSFSVETVLPSDMPEKNLAGKTACFKVAVKAVKMKRLPVLDDEFAKDLGVASVSELKEKVKTLLAAEKEASIKKEHKEHLVKKLIEMHPMEVPLPMITRELALLSREFNIEHAPDTLPPDTYKALQGIAENRAKKSLILDAIAEKEEIAVTEREMNDLLQKYKSMGIAVVGKEDMLQDPSFLRGVKEVVRQDKALERVYSLARCETV